MALYGKIPKCMTTKLKTRVPNIPYEFDKGCLTNIPSALISRGI